MENKSVISEQIFKNINSGFYFYLQFNKINTQAKILFPISKQMKLHRINYIC